MLNLKNQFILAPLKLGYSDGSGLVLQKHLEFYERRNKHIGAITPEPLYMHKGLRELPTQLGIDSDDKIEGLKQLVDTIRKNGARSIAHLNHPGRMANPKIPGNFWWSSTDKACENGGAVPEMMTREMMDEVVDMFVNSSLRAVKAGFDIIEIQFGHGYLLAQFISPAVNNRTDEYGGTYSNRIKFPLEVAMAVRKAVDVPIIARISGDEMIPNGFHLDDMIQFSSELEFIGINAIHVTAGSACSTPPWFFQHMFIPKGSTWKFAASIKSIINLPVIFVGRVNSLLDITLLNDKYKSPYIAVGRAMVADPDFVGKYLNKVDGIIRPCLACSDGCLGGVKSGLGLGCVVNPQVNTSFPPVIVDSFTKRYAVIGGGLAGMETAITLRDRGHDVDLFEKNELGGQFNLAYLPPNKSSLKEIVDYYIDELVTHSPHQVNIIKKEATPDIIQSGNYDAVVIATGAVPAVPPIKGLKKYYWTEFLDDDQLPNSSKVLVIGGGLIGLEVASKLVDGNNQVIIVEMLAEIARGMEMIEKALTVKKLKSKNVSFFINHKVTEVDNDKVTIEGDDGHQVIDGIDKIVVATGMNSYIPFEIKGATPVYFVGDAKKVGKAQDAIHGAYELAVRL